MVFTLFEKEAGSLLPASFYISSSSVWDRRPDDRDRCHSWGRHGARAVAACTADTGAAEAMSGDDATAASPGGHGKFVALEALPYD